MVTVHTGCGSVVWVPGEEKGRKLVFWWLLCLGQGCLETQDKRLKIRKIASPGLQGHLGEHPDHETCLLHRSRKERAQVQGEDNVPSNKTIPHDP